jgi:hypothetical protein
MIRPGRVSQVEPFSVGVAVTATEKLEAARLVGRMYHAEGYVANDGPYSTSHHRLPEATVFVAREQRRITGTLTVVRDSLRGLPMEELYGEELNALRAEGRALCEICSLAIEPGRRTVEGSPFLGLFRMACVYLVHFSPLTDALITLKPSHQSFYERRMGFQRFGAFRTDRRFQNADTVAMRLSRVRVERQTAGLDPEPGSFSVPELVYQSPTAAEFECLRQVVSDRSETLVH